MWAQCYIDPSLAAAHRMVHGLRHAGRAHPAVVQDRDVEVVCRPTNPLGIKAGGEVQPRQRLAVIVSGIVRIALRDTGIRDIAMPARRFTICIWQAIQRAKWVAGMAQRP